jgi:hypothetical protein
MAALRNLVIGVLCRAGPVNLAATPATNADPWPPSGSASDETNITTERRSPLLQEDTSLPGHVRTSSTNDWVPLSSAT